MTTTQNKKSTPAPAKRLTAKQKAEAAAAEAAKTEGTTPEAKTAVPAKPVYREAADFTDALKSAKASAKGNTDMTQPLQLITHLAWKSPNGKVGWANNTTQAVIDYAADIAVPEGTPIPEALDTALSIAEKAATEQPQKDALGVLANVIKGHHVA